MNVIIFNTNLHLDKAFPKFRKEHFLKLIDSAMYCLENAINVEDLLDRFPPPDFSKRYIIAEEIENLVMRSDRIYVEIELARKIDFLGTFFKVYEFDSIRQDGLSFVVDKHRHLFLGSCPRFRTILQKELFEKNMEEFKKLLQLLASSQNDIENDNLNISRLITRTNQLNSVDLNVNNLKDSSLENVGKGIFHCANSIENDYLSRDDDDKFYDNCMRYCFFLLENQFRLNMNLTILVNYPVFFCLIRLLFEDYRVKNGINYSLVGKWKEFRKSKIKKSKLHLTFDDNLFVKTISRKEFRLFHRFSSVYLMNFIINKDTFISKIYGIYSYKNKRKTGTFLVMSNIFPNYMNFKEKYDLKGYVNFSSKNKRPKKFPTLKGGNFIKNYPRGLFLKKDHFARIMKTLEKDTKILEQFCIIGYSLLLGIHNSDIHSDENNGEPLVHNNLSDCLIPAKTSGGLLVYIRLGIINILQWYSPGKVFESKLKRGFGKKKNTYVVDPAYYRERLLNFVASILHPEYDDESPEVKLISLIREEKLDSVPI